MLHQRIKPPSDVAKKPAPRKSIIETKQKIEASSKKIPLKKSLPSPTLVKKKIPDQTRLTVVQTKPPTPTSPKTSKSFDKIKIDPRKSFIKNNNKTSSNRVIPVTSGLKASSPKKTDCPRYVRENLFMNSKRRLSQLKIQCAPSNSLTISRKNSSNSLNKEKKTIVSPVESLKLQRSFSRGSIHAENSPKPLEKNTPKMSASITSIRSIPEKKLSLSPQPLKQESQIEKLQGWQETQVEELQKLVETRKFFIEQIQELKTFVTKKVPTSSEIKYPPFKTDQQMMDDKLISALQNNDLEKAGACLMLGANVNVADTAGETPIFHSILQGHLETTLFLKEHKADLTIKNKQGKTVFQKVCELNDVQKVKNILEIYPKEDTANTLVPALEMKTISNQIKQLIANEILFIAAKQNDVPLLAKALENGADINAQDERHAETALHKACQFTNLAVVECLLKNKCDIFLKDFNEQTPIQVTSNPDIKQRIAKYAITRTDEAIKTTGANIIQRNYRFFYSKKNNLTERSLPIIQELMKEKKFDEVTKLMQLFKDRHMLSLRLQLDYYEQMNSSNELTFKLENTKRRLIV